MNGETTLALTSQRQLCDSLVQQLQQTVELFMLVKQGVWKTEPTGLQEKACLVSLALQLERQMDLLAEHCLRNGASLDAPGFRLSLSSPPKTDALLEAVTKCCRQHQMQLQQAGALSILCQDHGLNGVLSEYALVLDRAVWQLEGLTSQPAQSMLQASAA